MLTHGHLDHAAGAAKLARELGVPIEGPHTDDTFLLEALGENALRPGFADVVVARVLKAERHPNADRLSLCEVDAGPVGRFSVVCGAPNVRAGMTAAYARVGARLPAGGAGAAAPRDLSLDLIRLRVQKSVSTPRFAERSLQGSDPAAALISTRPLTWINGSGDTPVYRWESLQPGNRVEGPAVLEGVNSTYFLPEGWGMLMDGWGNGSVRRRA